MARSKKRKIRYDRLFLLILVFVLLIVGLFFTTKYLLNKFLNNNADNNSYNNTNINENDLDFKLSIDNYELYFDKDAILGFNFAVVEINISSNNNIDYNLANLVTSEDVKLDDILNYSKKIKIASYDFDKLKTTTNIISDKTNDTFRVFVPFTSDKKLFLTDLITNETYKIDLNKNQCNLDDLAFVSNSSEIKSKNYYIAVFDSFISTMMTHNGLDYDCSMLNVYTFKLKIISIEKNITISRAVFRHNDEQYEALDESYSSYKIDNIINKNLNVDDEYALFFEVYGNQEEKIDYSGYIDLSFSDGSTVTIETELK